LEDIIYPVEVPESFDGNISEPVTSESNWVGKYSGKLNHRVRLCTEHGLVDVPSSAGVTKPISDIVSDSPGGGLSIPPYRRRISYYNISNWMHSVDHNTLPVITEEQQDSRRADPTSRYDESALERGVWLV